METVPARRALYVVRPARAADANNSRSRLPPNTCGAPARAARGPARVAAAAAALRWRRRRPSAAGRGRRRPRTCAQSGRGSVRLEPRGRRRAAPAAAPAGRCGRASLSPRVCARLTPPRRGARSFFRPRHAQGAGAAQARPGCAGGTRRRSPPAAAARADTAYTGRQRAAGGFFAPLAARRRAMRSSLPPGARARRVRCSRNLGRG